MVAELERRGDLSRPQVWQCPAKKWRVTGTADSQKRKGWDYGGTVNSELTTEWRGRDHGDIGDAAEIRPEPALSVAENSHLAKLIELLRSTKIKQYCWSQNSQGYWQELQKMIHYKTLWGY